MGEMRVRALSAVLVALLVLPVLTGCWSRTELNDLGIQMGLAVDMDGNGYNLAVQVVVPGSVTSQTTRSSSAVTMFKATAPTLFSAFRKLTETSPRKVYGAHIRVLVIGEELAREGIAQVLDLLLRDPEVRSDFYVLIARDTTAESVLRIMTDLEQIPANHLFQSLDTSARAWAPTTPVTLDRLIESMLTEGSEAVLTGVWVDGNEKIGNKKANIEEIKKAAQLRVADVGVLKKDRLIGWLTEEESRGFNYITNQVTGTAAYITCPDGRRLALEVIRSNTEMKGRIVNGKPEIVIKVVDESNVAEAGCEIDLNRPETLQMLEKAEAKRKIELMQHAVETVQRKYKLDIFGFGQAIYRADPKAWHKLKDDWPKHFAELQIEYDVHIHIRRVGMSQQPLQRQLKE